MQLLIMSDSHGNVSYIDSLLSIAKSSDMVIHLGDNYSDAKGFLEYDLPMIRVPGTWGWEYQDAFIDNRRFETFNGWRFFLTHTPTSDPNDRFDDLNPETVIQNKECDIFCHGHSHKPMINHQNNVCILNPGHLKSAVDRGYKASYAILHLTKPYCLIQIFDFETGEVVMDRVLNR